MDVFISYSRAHRWSAFALAELLRRYAVDVWFDVEIRPGALFADEIHTMLERSACVLVLWTEDTIAKGASSWVHSEADWALQRGKLIQAELEPVLLKPPFFTSVVLPLDFRGLRTGLSRSVIGTLLRSIAQHTARPGLEEIVDAEASDRALLAWTRRYQNDPLASRSYGFVAEAVCRARARETIELERVRRAIELEDRLEATAEDALIAPVDGGTATFASEKIHPGPHPSTGPPRPPKECPTQTNRGLDTTTSKMHESAAALFTPDALRVLMHADDQRRCSCGVIAASRLFLVNPTASLLKTKALRGVVFDRLELLLVSAAEHLLIGDGIEDLAGMTGRTAPIYGPPSVEPKTDVWNQAAGLDGVVNGFQAWGPSPEPERSVIIFEGDGLVVSAFTTAMDAFDACSYRFDYRGRSIVIASSDVSDRAPAAAAADAIFSLSSASWHTSSMVPMPLASGPHKTVLLELGLANSDVLQYVLDDDTEARAFKVAL